MKYYILTATLLLHFLPSLAQKTILATIKKDGKYGCINIKGKEVIPVKYDALNDWSEGLRAVNLQTKDTAGAIKRDKWGFCNTKGKIVIPVKFDYARDFKEKFAAFRSDSFWGFIDHKGHIIIKPAFKSVMDFSEGLCAVQLQNDKWGYINHEGKWAIEPRFDGALNFKDGLSRVAINKTGIVSPDSVSADWGIIDKTGKYIAQPAFSLIGDFHEGYAWVRFGGYPPFNINKSGFINRQGKITRLEKFNCNDDFHDGMAMVYLSDKPQVNLAMLERFKRGFIDTTGKLVNNEAYDDATDFSGGYAIVKKKNMLKWMPIHIDSTKPPSDYPLQSACALIDKTGKKVIDFIYYDLDKTDLPGVYIAKLNQRYYGVINIKGEILLPFKYNQLQYIGQGCFAAESWFNPTGVINIKGDTLFKISRMIDPEGEFHFGLLKVYDFGEKFVNIKGETVIKAWYDSISDFEEVGID